MKPTFFRKCPDQASDRPAVIGAACMTPGIPDDPAGLYAKIRDEAIAYGEELTTAITADLREGELARLEALWQKVPFCTGVVKTASFAIAQAATPTRQPSRQLDPAVPQYFISSRFLTECARFLLADPNGYERLHLVSGVQPGANRYTLEYMDKVAMDQQSERGARADQRAFTRALIHLTEWGQALHGLFHSHPGEGAGCTHPSPTDVTTHKRLEQGDYPLIGAIFVPGYVRFFSTNRPFTVTIHGRGVTPLPGEKHVYKIQNPSMHRGVSYETITAEDER